MSVKNQTTWACHPQPKVGGQAEGFGRVPCFPRRRVKLVWTKPGLSERGCGQEGRLTVCPAVGLTRDPPVRKSTGEIRGTLVHHL